MNKIRYHHDGYQSEIVGYIAKPKGPIKAIVQIVHDRYDHCSRYTDLMTYFADRGCVCFGFDLAGHGESSVPKIFQYPQMMVDEIHDGFLQACHILEEDIIKRSSSSLVPLPHVLIGFGFGALLARLYLMKYRDTSALILCGDEGFVKHSSLIRKVQNYLKRNTSEIYIKEVHKKLHDDYNIYFKNDDQSKFAWRTSLGKEQAKLIGDPYVNKQYTLNQYSGMLSLTKNNEASTWIEACPSELPVFLMSGYYDSYNRFTRNLDTFLELIRRSTLSNVCYRYYPNSRHELLFDVDCKEALQDMYHFIHILIKQLES